MDYINRRIRINSQKAKINRRVGFIFLKPDASAY